jgi:hypothetical protein
MGGDFLSPIPGQHLSERWDRPAFNQTDDAFIRSPTGRFTASGGHSPTSRNKNNFLGPG